MIKLVALLLGLVFVLCSCGVAGTPPPPTPVPPPTVQPKPPTVVPFPTALEHPVPTPLPIPTPGPATIPATHGLTRLGQPVTNFVYQYGQPMIESSGRYQWSTPTYDLVVGQDSNGQTNWVNVQAPGQTTWDQMTTQRMCFLFMPAASTYKTALGKSYLYDTPSGVVQLTPTTFDCTMQLVS